MHWKETLNSIPGCFGYEIRRLRTPFIALRHAGIRTVIDVGANKGQFYRSARKAFPGAAIHSFEPLPAAAGILAEISKGDSLLHVHNFALGSTDGEASFVVNSFSPSSSLLPLAQDHKAAFPFAQEQETIQVRVRSLDSWAVDRPLQQSAFLKVDVQGFDAEVLRGAQTVLPRCAAVLIEANFVDLYQGQSSLIEISELLGRHGLAFADLYHGPLDANRLPLFADVLFLAPRLAPAAPILKSEPRAVSSGDSGA